MSCRDRRPAAAAGRRRRGEAGFAIALALFAVFLLAVGAALLASSLELRVRVARDEARTVVRATLLDAALAEALAHLAASASYPGTPEHPFGGGAIASTVESLGLGRYRIVVRGAFRGRDRTAVADVLRVEHVVPAEGEGGTEVEARVELRILGWRPLPRAAGEERRARRPLSP